MDFFNYKKEKLFNEGQIQTGFAFHIKIVFHKNGCRNRWLRDIVPACAFMKRKYIQDTKRESRISTCHRILPKNFSRITSAGNFSRSALNHVPKVIERY